MRITGIAEYSITIQLTGDECKVLESIAAEASTADFEHQAEAERYQTLFQLAIQTMRAADYDSARGKLERTEG